MSPTAWFLLILGGGALLVLISLRCGESTQLLSVHALREVRQWASEYPQIADMVREDLAKVPHLTEGHRARYVTRIEGILLSRATESLREYVKGE